MNAIYCNGCKTVHSSEINGKYSLIDDYKKREYPRIFTCTVCGKKIGESCYLYCYGCKDKAPMKTIHQITNDHKFIDEITSNLKNYACSRCKKHKIGCFVKYYIQEIEIIRCKMVTEIEGKIIL